jgi:PDZ domain-containing protein
MRVPGLEARTVLATASAAVVAASALSVPMPLVEYRPGGATEIAPLVTVEGAAITPLSGDTALLTVRLVRQPAAQALVAWLDPDRDLIPAARVFPQGVDRQVYLARERERFSRQFDVAAAVGAAAAGVPLEILTEVVIVEVVAGAPADGVLAPGDVVTALDGTPVTSGADLAERIRVLTPGTTVTLTVEHQGSAREQPVTLAALDDTGEARLGVLVQTAVDELLLPIDVVLSPEVRIGGPSAGLMVGLTVYDLLAEEDLLAGRRVAGTGTLDVDGTVGPVGGVPQKVEVAIDAGYEVLLVPTVSTDEALRVADGRIEVAGVATLDEALVALRR